LIEINTNPGLEESSPWIKLIVPRMLDDALRLTIDQLFETKYDFDLVTKSVKENNIYENILIRYNQLVKEKDELNKKDFIEENKNENNENNNDENKIINNSDEKKKNNNKNKAYISPFPVPGYTLEENIWDYVCDLDNPDPLDELNKEEFIEENNIGNNENNNNENKINNNSGEKKKNNNKNKKYISPFPIPGYNLYENLWDFVCDLKEQEPMEEIIDKDEDLTKENSDLKNNSYKFNFRKRKNKKGKKRKMKLMKRSKNKNLEKEDKK
jgi:hypothetical protein